MLSDYGEFLDLKTIAGLYRTEINSWLYSVASIIGRTPRDGVTTGAIEIVCKVPDNPAVHINNGDIYFGTLIQAELNMSHISCRV